METRNTLSSLGFGTSMDTGSLDIAAELDLLKRFEVLKDL